MINEYDIVMTIRSVENIPIGSKGTVLIVYSDSEEYEVEFVDGNGDTISVLTVNKSDIKKLE